MFIWPSSKSYVSDHVWNRGMRFLDKVDENNTETIKTVMVEGLHITDESFQEQCSKYVQELVAKHLDKLFGDVVSKYRKELRDCKWYMLDHQKCA